jgi:hypothetical protein
MDNMPLPITWLNFTTQKLQKSVLLKWSTATEQNALNYTIQHSWDGIVWINIGYVSATGTTILVSNYSYTDITPLSGNNYYRIVQKDINGNENLSKTESVSFILDYLPIVVLQKIITDGKLSIQTQQPTTMNLYNSNGNLVLTKKLISGIQYINVENFSKGVYFLKANTETVKIVIQ